MYVTVADEEEWFLEWEHIEVSLTFPHQRFWIVMLFLQEAIPWPPFSNEELKLKEKPAGRYSKTKAARGAK